MTTITEKERPLGPCPACKGIEDAPHLINTIEHPVADCITNGHLRKRNGACIMCGDMPSAWGPGCVEMIP
jgi:hypothetical protein